MSGRIDPTRMQELVAGYRTTREEAARAETALFEYMWEPLLAFVTSITRGQLGVTDPALSSTRRFFETLEKDLPRNSLALLFTIARHRVAEDGRRTRPTVAQPDWFEAISTDANPVLDEAMFNELMGKIGPKNLDLIDQMSKTDREIIRSWLLTADVRQTAEKFGCTEAEVDRVIKRYRKMVLRWLFP